MADEEAPQSPPESWLAAIARAEADAAAGRVFEGAAIHRRLEEAAKALESSSQPVGAPVTR